MGFIISSTRAYHETCAVVLSVFVVRLVFVVTAHAQDFVVVFYVNKAEPNKK